MRVYRLLGECDTAAGMLVERLAEQLQMKCASRGIHPSDAKTVAMWGGGKDSTLAVILIKAVSELVGCPVISATMLHPGLTADALANIERVRQQLGIAHEYWHFRRRISASAPWRNDWAQLYQQLAKATKHHPRFMCIACNMGSIVAEYAALAEHNACFRVTGNPPWEFARFDEWICSLRTEYANIVDFPPIVGNATVDYFRFWWAIYRQLIAELFGPGRRPDRALLEQAWATYLYPLPTGNDPTGRSMHFCVMGDDSLVYRPAQNEQVLVRFGWRLPEDLQGGTESDCAFTSAIAALNIRQNGLDKHMKDLVEAERVFEPLPEMIRRAREWALSGKSVSEGQRLLASIGLNLHETSDERQDNMVALALARKLFPIR